MTLVFPSKISPNKHHGADELCGTAIGLSSTWSARLPQLEFVVVELQYPTSADSLHLARGNHVQRTASLGLLTQPIPDLHQ